MKRKRNKCKKRKLFKYLPIILICVLFSPANYSGKRLDLKASLTTVGSLNKQRHTTTRTSAQNLEETFMNNEKVNDVSDPAKLIGKLVIINIFILIPSAALISLILGYLSNTSILKQGLVLFLYQDTARLVLLFWLCVLIRMPRRLIQLQHFLLPIPAIPPRFVIILII